MNAGMLWLDDDKKRPFTEKVERAVKHYQDKYGRSPNACFVNAGQLAEEQRVNGVVIRPLKNVLKDHFWIGVENE